MGLPALPRWKHRLSERLTSFGVKRRNVARAERSGDALGADPLGFNKPKIDAVLGVVGSVGPGAAKKGGDPLKGFAPDEGVRTYGLRQRITVPAYITAITIVAVLVPSTIAGLNAYHMQYRKSLTDTWALLFLESEKSTFKIASRVSQVALGRGMVGYGTYVTAPKDAVPQVLYRAQTGKKAKRVAGVGGPAEFNPDNFGVKDRQGPVRLFVARLGQESWLFRAASPAEVASMLPKGPAAVEAPKGAPKGKGKKSSAQPAALSGAARAAEINSGSYLVGWPLNFGRVMRDIFTVSANDGLVYIVTRNGDLVYANMPWVTQAELRNRPLVTEFVASNAALGQLEFTDGLGDAYYGFFREIPGTNLVFFEESSKEQALTALRELAQRYGLSLVGILAVALLLIQLPLRSVTRPIHELVTLSREIAQGNFNVQPKHQGFGELVALTTSFKKMGMNLVARDRAITTLMKEQQEKIRMEREFAVAKNLQDGFLPRAALTIDSGLLVQAKYQPAANVAGDWFNYDWSPAAKETVIVIADVSGHDMAASMFTAIIASVFYDARHGGPNGAAEPFRTREFLARLNRQIRHFGGGQWHATVQVMTYTQGAVAAEVTNCGHTFPLVLTAGVDENDAPTVKAKTIKLPSDPLGLSDQYKVSSAKVELTGERTVLLYTDGLVEAKRPDGKRFGTRRAAEIAQKAFNQGPKGIVEVLIRDCLRFRGNGAGADDLCLIAVRGTGATFGGEGDAGTAPAASGDAA
jgi:serine phosphatase RsbU (regulator of sigma subunit)